MGNKNSCKLCGSQPTKSIVTFHISYLEKSELQNNPMKTQFMYQLTVLNSKLYSKFSSCLDVLS